MVHSKVKPCLLYLSIYGSRAIGVRCVHVYCNGWEFNYWSSVPRADHNLHTQLHRRTTRNVFLYKHQKKPTYQVTRVWFPHPMMWLLCRTTVKQLLNQWCIACIALCLLHLVYLEKVSVNRNIVPCFPQVQIKWTKLQVWKHFNDLLCAIVF